MAKMPSARQLTSPMDTDGSAPTMVAPLRCVRRSHLAKTDVQSHYHPWVQIVFCTRGIIRVAMEHASYTVPPWNAVWIPAGVAHTTAVVDTADLHALYLLADPIPGREQSPMLTALSCFDERVIEVGILLQGLVTALTKEEPAAGDRYDALCRLTLMELLRAPIVAIGITLPSERRLRAFCDAFLQKPSLELSMGVLSKHAGASVSTIARLFQSELGTSFVEWRKQVLLAHSLTLATRGLTVTQIAFELGYSNPSAFTFMVTQLVGISPSKFMSLSRSPEEHRE